MQDRNDSSQGYHFQDDDPGRVDPWAYQAYRGEDGACAGGNIPPDPQDRRRKGGRGGCLAALIIFILVMSVFPVLFATHMTGGSDSSDDEYASGDEYGEEYEGWAEEEEAQETEDEGPDPAEAVTWQAYGLPRELLLVLENGNAQGYRLEISVLFRDEAGTMLSVEDAYVQCCPPGGKNVASVQLPRDPEGNLVPYADYDITVNVEESSYENYAAQISIESNLASAGGVVAALTNGMNQEIRSLDLVCVYYQAGQAVGYDTNYLYDLKDTAAVEFDAPTDAQYEPVLFDDYEIIVTDTSVD